MQEQLLWRRAYNPGSSLSGVETPGEIIKKAREAKGWSQDDLASASGVTQPAIVKIENGKTRKSKFFPKIAQVLELDLARIDPSLQADAKPANYRPPPTVFGDRDLPVYAAAEGGPGQMVVNTDPVELVPRPWYLGNVKDGYAVLVVGDSMEPAFKAGDMAIVNPRLAYQRNTDVILVAREDEGEFVATIKHLLGWTDKEWKLRQFNPRKDFTLSRKEWPKALRVVGRYYGA